MVDMKKTLWSNRAMRASKNHMPETQRRKALAVRAQLLPAPMTDRVSQSLVVLGALLALLLIIGRGAGSG